MSRLAHRRAFILTAHHVVDPNNDGTITPTEALGVGTAAVEVDFRTTTCGGTVSAGVALIIHI